ncbi:MAG: 2-oxo acid dehydrogenase subunit E2 [Prolixibacteraceae bacterium]|nr:2-oxo acid dehydrogenase subunit E2 [Prolixibacteraceae bacterium]MBN2773303.1 2-oxo acid dehydrogenase subunit E2 [Prolixibacteraceae bacterium]
MSQFKVIMPKLGESIQEATITKWFVKEGDTVEEDDNLFEVATDKVDSEIPSPVDGVISKILHPVDAVLPVGEVLAIIITDGEGAENEEQEEIAEPENNIKLSEENIKTESTRFYSPLVKSIARQENISAEELETIPGSGINGRVQKKDILNYLENKGSKQSDTPVSQPKMERPPVSIGKTDQIIEMDRVRKMIADHMVLSKQVSPHVTSVVEADVTNLVFWREKNKNQFQQKYGEKLTYMHVFTEAVAQALAEFPLLNSSVDGSKIILKKDINIGIAVAKPDGNLIVPVIRNAEQKNLVGITKELNRLADAARNNKLSPDEIQGGTFTITNFGTFRNLIGTPIINQPQVAILATGSIEKKPAVMETPTGDAIVIRHKMFLSLSYDHRIIDGALGGAFLRRIADLLEEFKIDRTL